MNCQATSESDPFTTLKSDPPKDFFNDYSYPFRVNYRSGRQQLSTGFVPHWDGWVTLPIAVTLGLQRGTPLCQGARDGVPLLAVLFPQGKVLRLRVCKGAKAPLRGGKKTSLSNDNYTPD